MPDTQIRFDDGAAYESFMGVWSRLAGSRFLDWLAPAAGGRWADVGCGNGAFTELLVERCAPAAALGIDPSEEQVAYARGRLAPDLARFAVGDATALPWADASVDAAVMALVIFFVPDPAKAVAEMARVVRPGGSVSAYSWDMLGGGFPYAAVLEELSATGVALQMLPSVEASRNDFARALWAGAGLEDVDTCEIVVERTFASFDSFWAIARSGPRVAPHVSGMGEDTRARLGERLRARLKTDADGRITVAARANAIRGRVPSRP